MLNVRIGAVPDSPDVVYSEATQLIDFSNNDHELIRLTMQYLLAVAKQPGVLGYNSRRQLRLEEMIRFVFRLLAEYLSVGASDLERQFYKHRYIRTAVLQEYKETLVNMLHHSATEECVDWLLSEPAQFLKRGYREAAARAA